METVRQYSLLTTESDCLRSSCFFVDSLLHRPSSGENRCELPSKWHRREFLKYEKLLEYSQKFGKGANFNALLIETDAQGLTDPEVIEAIYNMEDQIRATGASAYSIADEIKKD